MTEKADRRTPPARAAGWAITGLLFVIAGPAVYMLLIDNAVIRATGAVAFGLMSAGAVLGLFAAWVDRRIWVRVIGLLNVALLAAFAYVFFDLTRLPAAPQLGGMETAPDFTLPDQNGNPVTLSAVWADGPVLLVFYRGHW